MQLLTDTHCHLDFEAFDADRDAVLARAMDAGIVRILNPGTDLRSSEAAIKLAETTPIVYAAVGVHPNSALVWDSAADEQLRELAGHPKVVAIGEIGLDYYREGAPREIQREILWRQLDLAGEIELPVIIHNREATADLIPILSEWRQALLDHGSPLAEHPGVLHSFSESTDAARQALDMGFYIGFTGPVTFKNARDLQEVASRAPIERMLLETDAPYLAPHPMRGQRNEPAYVRLIAAKIADLQGLAIDHVCLQTTANAAVLFDWGERD